MYKTSIRTFLFGMIVGVGLGLLFLAPLSTFNMDISVLRSRIFVPESETVPEITSDVGNHSTHDAHHLMTDESLANQLYNEVKILCWIMTGPQNHDRKAKHVKATWAKRCNTYIFMSTKEDPSLPSVALPVIENRDNLWGKTKEALKYVYNHHYNDYDWFFKADDDTYAIMENMRYLLRNHSPSDPIYFGFRFKPFAKQGYMSGGGGYVLSKEALRRFVTEGLPNPDKCKQENTGAEDAEIGKCLEKVQVLAGDSRDTEGRSRFLPLFVTDFLIPGAKPPTWFNQYTYYPFITGMECCSDNIITTHYVNPHQLYLLEYLIYHVQPFGIAYNPVLPVQPIPSNVTEKNENTQDKQVNVSQQLKQ